MIFYNKTQRFENFYEGAITIEKDVSIMYDPYSIEIKYMIYLENSNRRKNTFYSIYMYVWYVVIYVCISLSK